MNLLRTLYVSISWNGVFYKVTVVIYCLECYLRVEIGYFTQKMRFPCGTKETQKIIKIL